MIASARISLLIWACLLTDQCLRILALARGRNPITPPEQVLRESALVYVPLESGAACLDGTPYAFTITPGDAKRWTFHFDGGGDSCANAEDCEKKAASHYGSSSATDNRTGTGCHCRNFPASTWKAVDCTCVLMPYCDGAYFLGDLEQPYQTATGKQLYMRGRRNLLATLDILLNAYGLADATDLLVTGHSSGGLSTILNLDTVAGAMPPTMKVRGIPVAGFIPDVGDCCGEGNCCYDECCYSNKMSQLFYFHNMSNSISSDCNASNVENPSHCLLGGPATQFVKTPMFILNSKYDAFGLRNLVGMEFKPVYIEQGGIHELFDQVREYGIEFMKQFMSYTQNTKHSAFITSCICHAACGLDNTSWNTIYQKEWLGNILERWYVQSENETNQTLYIDESEQNYDCDAGGQVEQVA